MNTKWEQVGTIGVDAGLCWVGDPCYVINRDPGTEHSDVLGKTWGDFCDKLGNEYPTVKEFDGLGLAVSSGYGDGLYPVFIKKNEEGRIVRLMVKFD